MISSNRVKGVLFLVMLAGAGAQTTPPDGPPRAIRQVAPVYPAALREQHVVGMVHVRCLITEKGTVDQVKAEKSAYPEFDLSATEAVRQSVFQPAIKGGRPYALAVSVPVEFSLSEEDLAALETRRPKEVMPAGPPCLSVTEVDEWPALKKEIRPATPKRLRDERRMGQAVMAFVVDELGVPRDIHVVMTTDTECVTAAADAIRRWQFSPGKKTGRAVRVAMKATLVFFPEDSGASGLRVRPGVATTLPAEEAAPELPGGQYLPPRPIKQKPPEFPEEMSNRRQRGLLVVDFIIGPSGLVTAVKAQEGAPPFFAIMSERAISYWKFSPATKGGVPVSCRVRQVFEFLYAY